MNKWANKLKRPFLKDESQMANKVRKNIQHPYLPEKYKFKLP